MPVSGRSITGLRVPAGAAGHFVGAHHFGFQVDDIAEVQQKIEAAGGTFFFDLGDDQEKENFERKFKDPDGIIFDISKKGWLGTNLTVRLRGYWVPTHSRPRGPFR